MLFLGVSRNSFDSVVICSCLIVFALSLKFAVDTTENSWMGVVAFAPPMSSAAIRGRLAAPTLLLPNGIAAALSAISRSSILLNFSRLYPAVGPAESMV